jgi:hypothetical protein
MEEEKGFDEIIDFDGTSLHFTENPIKIDLKTVQDSLEKLIGSKKF